MSLSTNVLNFATRVGTEFKAVRASIGTLASLTTADKTSVVNAINEVKTAVGGAGAQINDSVTNTSTTWSGSKTNSTITSATAAIKADILGGAGPTIDTLKEIADLLTASDVGDDAALATLTTAVGNRVRYDAAQTLSGPQQAQALTNIGAVSAVDVGDVNTNFVTAFETALA